MTQRKEHYDRDAGQNGIVVPFGYPHAVASTAVTADRAYYARFVPSRNMLIDEIAFCVTAGTAPTAINYDVGIYSDYADLRPDTRLVSNGGTNSTLVTNFIHFGGLVDYALTAGTIYWAAWACDSALPSLMMATWPGTAGVGLMPGSVAMYEEAAYPLPATSNATLSASAVPILGLQE